VVFVWSLCGWSDMSVHPQKNVQFEATHRKSFCLGNGYPQAVGLFECCPQKITFFECYPQKVTFDSRVPTEYFQSYRVTHRKMLCFHVAHRKPFYF